MTESNDRRQSAPPDDTGGTRSSGKKKKLYDVSIFNAWCKACGICAAFCPKKIIRTDKAGIPFIDEPDHCSGCRFCEKHCPDFAITVNERAPRRRKTDG